jgi:hypothetical protein
MRVSTFLRRQQESTIVEWGENVRHIPSEARLPTLGLLNHVPQILDGVADALDGRPGALQHTIACHADVRLQQRIPLTEVVREYEALRDVVHRRYRGQGGRQSLATFDRILDEAIEKTRNSFAESS